MKRALVIIICISFFITAGMLSAAVPIEDMIKNAGTADDHKGSPGVVVFDRTHVDVKHSGLSIVERDYLVKILTPGGVKDFTSLRMNYDPATNMVDIREVVIYRNNGTAEKIELEKNTRDIPQPQWSIIWGARMKVIEIPRLNVGDALRFKTLKKGFEIAYLYSAAEDDERYIPPLRGEFYDKVYFADRYPIIEKTYKVKIPRDKPFQYKIYNGELKSSLSYDKNFFHYTWKKYDIKPYHRKRGEVGLSDTETKLIISTLSGWEEKSVWFYEANKNQFEVTDEIKAKVDELIEGKKTDEEKIAALNHWVAQNIRYMGLNMGEGEGYTVHTGIMTFEDRLGVCKDKAGMLATMLVAAGYEARVAMTMAGGRVEDVPADQFNHCVTVLKRGENDYVLLDPTWIPYSREMWSSAEQNQQYLIGDKPGVDLKTTPSVPAEEMKIAVTDASEIDSKGNLKGTIEIEAHGYPEQRLRRLLAGRPNRDVKDIITTMLSDISERIEVTDYSFTSPTDFSKPINITIEYQVNNYGIKSISGMILAPPLTRNPLHIGYVTRWLGYAKPDKRENPVDNWGTFYYVYNGKTKLPAGYEAKIIPDDKEITGPSADYGLKIERDDSAIKIDHYIKIKKRFIPPEEYPNYRDAVRALNDAKFKYVLLGK